MIHTMAEPEVAFSRHIQQFNPNIWVFIFAHDMHAVYVDGMLSSMGETGTRNPREDTRHLARCIKVGPVMTIESSPELEDYLATHEAFPLWLRDLIFIEQPEYLKNKHVKP